MTKRKKQQAATQPDQRMLAVVYKAPGEAARAMMVDDSRAALEAIVGGPLDVAALTKENMVVCNRDGRRLGLAPNALGIAGPLVILGKGDGETFGDVYRAEDILAVLCGDWMPRG